MLAYTQERLPQVVYLDSFRDASCVKSKNVGHKTRHWEKRRTMSHKSFKIRRILRMSSSYVEQNSGCKRRKIDGIAEDNVSENSRNGFLRYDNLKRCREFRRRISYLVGYLHNMHLVLPNYDDSKQSIRWLDNHLWFRKRMKMENQWGFCLPTYHSSRGYKSLRHALKEGCTIHDMSYIRPIQISSTNLTDLVSFINNYIDNCVENLQQFKEMQVNIYFNKCGPNLTYLGCANLMFLSLDKNSQFKFWLWCHPSFYYTILKEFRQSSVKFESLSVSELDIGFNRYHTCGMNSTQLIRKVMGSILCNRSMGDSITSNEDFFASLINSESLNAIWETDMAMSLNINDDRWGIEKINKENQITINCRKKFDMYWKSKYDIIGNSLIFDEVELKVVSSKFRPDNICNECKYQKKKTLNSTTNINRIINNEVRLTQDFHPIPILIIRKHSDNMIFRGYDIIIPSKWGPYIWNKLYMAGGRAIGMNENDYIQLSSTKLSFPRDYPETCIGATYWNASDYSYFKDCIVLRDKKVLIDFDPFISNKMGKGFLKLSEFKQSIEKIHKTPHQKRFLVNISLTVTSRGRPLEGARLYLPNEHDYKIWMLHSVNRKVPIDPYGEKGLVTGKAMK